MTGSIFDDIINNNNVINILNQHNEIIASTEHKVPGTSMVNIKNEIFKNKFKNIDITYRQISYIPLWLREINWEIVSINFCNNRIKEFDPSLIPRSCIELNISNNMIEKINNPNNTIKYLALNNNLIRSFKGSLFASLDNLEISYNNLEAIQFPPNLKICRISHNNIKNIQKIPNSLDVLIERC